MALVDGEHLNRYVAPQLIQDIRNIQDTFTQFFGTVNRSAITADGVSVQKLINDIAVKTGLDASATLTPRSIAGKKGVIPWNNFTTETLKFNKEELRALAFDKKSAARQMLIDAVINAMLRHALHAISPDSHTAKTVLISTSGDDDGSGRKMMVPKDITNLLRLSDIENPVLVLAKSHLLDLQEGETTAKRFADLVVSQRDMKPMPYAGVRMVAADVAVRYTAGGAKRALAAVSDPEDRFASVVIDKTNTIYYMNDLFFTMTEMDKDTRNEIPRTEMRIYGEFMAINIEDDRKRAAIIDTLI